MECQIQELVGKTLVSIEVSPDKDEILFTSTTGKQWKMYHDQYCCESVEVEDIIGTLSDLLNSPMIMAEEVSFSDENPEGGASKRMARKLHLDFLQVGYSKGLRDNTLVWRV